MNAQIFDALSQGDAFVNPLPSLSTASQGLVASGTASATGLNNIADTQVKNALAAGGMTTTKIGQANTMYGSANTSITTLNNYGDQSINEAYSRMGTSVSYKSGLKGIDREPNNCDLINNAFGVVQNLGAQWLNNMQSALQTVTDKMNELYELASQGVSAGLAKITALAAEVTGYVNTAITEVSAVVQSVTEGIASELAHIQNMVNQCLNFSFANVLEEWSKDICAGGVIKNIGSSDLKNALK